MKKIFARQKDGGKGSTKITPLNLDSLPPGSNSQQKRSPDGPMQFARHSVSDEPDPWVLVSDATNRLLNADGIVTHTSPQPRHPLRRKSNSTDDFKMQNPRPMLESRPPSHAILPAGASPPVPGTGNGVGAPNTPQIGLTPTIVDKEKEHRGLLKWPKSNHSHNPTGILRALDPRANERSNDSLQAPPSPKPQPQREESIKTDKESERHEKRKVSGHSEKKERTRDKERDKDRDHKDKDHRKDEDHNDVSLRSMIGEPSSSLHVQSD